jgi:Sap, sulfolipid-1-addressing protein
VGWIDAELILVALAAMLSPTTLSFSVLALVIGDRPRRTGLWFYAGALSATLVIGIVGAFVIGDLASSSTPSQPPTWVAVFDVVAAVVLTVWIIRVLRRPPNPKRLDGMVDQMRKVAGSSVIAIVVAGAALANPGGFIPIALKTISQMNASSTQYIVDWLFFSLVSLLPLGVAVAMLFISQDWTGRALKKAQDWLLHNARKVAAGIVFLLAASLLRNGLVGLTN